MRSRSSALSPGWVVVSYFTICGGLALATVGLAFVGMQTLWHGLAAFALGSALGGFFTGRASPHVSVLEPGIAGALVVGSVYGLVGATEIGELAFAYAGSNVRVVALSLGAAGLVGGVIGALLGEWSSDGLQPSGLRWIGVAALIAAGVLFASVVFASVVLINEAATQALSDLWAGRETRGRVIDEERLVVAAALCLGATAFLGGLVSQMAAPKRYLLGSALGPAVTIAALVVGGAVMLDRFGEASRAIAVTVGIAAVIALVGAVVGLVLHRVAGGRYA